MVFKKVKKKKSHLFKARNSKWKRRLQHLEGNSPQNSQKRCYRRLTKGDKIDRLKPITKFNETATVLRPLDARGLVDNQPDHTTNECDVYRLVHVGKTSDLIGKACALHIKLHPLCPSDLFLSVDNEKKNGFATAMPVHCRLCNFKTDSMELYRRVSYKKNSSKCVGHAEPNIRLAAWHLASNITLESVFELPLYLNASPICQKTLQRHVNLIAPSMVELGKKTIQENRNTLKEVLEVTNNTGGIVVAVDSAYNNPPKGRAFQQNGTQSCTPMVEKMTQKQLVVGLKSLSQICSCERRYKGLKCSSNCSANVASDKNLSSMEGDMAMECISELKADGLHVKAAIADCSNTISKKLGAAGVEHRECAVHITRATRRKMYNTAQNLSKKCKESCGEINAMTIDIVNRVQSEFTLGRRQFPNDDRFLKHMEGVQSALVHCLGGEHNACHSKLLACSFTKAKKYHHLQKEYKFTAKDRREVQKVIDHKISQDRVCKQINGEDTNMVILIIIYHKKLMLLHKNLVPFIL